MFGVFSLFCLKLFYSCTLHYTTVIIFTGKMLSLPRMPIMLVIFAVFAAVNYQPCLAAAIDNQQPQQLLGQENVMVDAVAISSGPDEDDGPIILGTSGIRIKRQRGTCINRLYNWESWRESNCREACANDGCYTGHCVGDKCRCFHRNNARC